MNETATAETVTVNFHGPDLENTPTVAQLNLAAAGLPVVHAPRRGFVGVGYEKLKEVAAMMADSGPMVPWQFQAEVVGREKAMGRCLAIAYQADRWGMDPIAVCSKAYVVVSQAKDDKGKPLVKDGQPIYAERISYEAQLIHAIILAFAPLADFPTITYGYAGSNHTAQFRFCHVLYELKSGKQLPIVSPTVAQIKVKNSPLWFSDVDQQLAFYTCRAGARRHFPHILMGIYTREELEVTTVHEIGVTRRPHFEEDDTASKPVDAEFSDEAAAAAWSDKPQPTAEELAAHGRAEAKANNSDSRDPRDAPENQQGAGNPGPGRAKAEPPPSGGLEHDKAASDRASVATLQAEVIGDSNLESVGRKWTALRLTAEWKRLKTYQPDIAAKVIAAVDAHAQRLRQVREAGGNPATGEVE